MVGGRDASGEKGFRSKDCQAQSACGFFIPRSLILFLMAVGSGIRDRY